MGEVPGTKPVATPSAKPSSDSVLTGKDGVDLALVQAGKQKAAERKISLTPMFVDAKGRTRTWPASEYSAYFLQDDMVFNACSKLATLDDVKLGRGEVAEIRKPADGSALKWVKLPWRVTTGRSIWVSLLGNHGQKSKTDVQVYVLTAGEFSGYWAKRKNKETPKLTPSGIAPLLVQDIKPGRYVVGVQYTLDMGVVKQPVTAGISGPLEYVEDDVSDACEIRSSNIKPKDGAPVTSLSCIRWYPVDVTSETVHPVVSLLIPKGELLSRYGFLYPRPEQFRIDACAELRMQLWILLEKAGTQTTTQRRKKLLNMLVRGGRVCVPNAKSPTVIFLDSDGTPRIATRNRKQANAESHPPRP